ncbi:MAG: hypothetical protein ACREVD_04555 [Burkholderiales bacterium]
MKKILLALVGGAMIGLFAASHAKLPAPPPKSDAEKAAEVSKAAAAKAKNAELLDKAQDKAVANYKKNKGIAMDAKPAKSAKAGKKN